jgi:8-oxo-dGTP pyrophosphatase MutT (NUDIX family)
LNPFAASLTDIEDFRRRALSGSGLPAAGPCGDHALNPDAAEAILNGQLRDAAVLVAAVERGGRPHLIMTQRTEGLRTHSGQVAFPGGRIDPGDGSPERAALRETQEEIGIPASAVEVIGRMPDYVSGSGYRIAPVLAITDPGFAYRLNPAEVADAFEVPLDFLMDPANHRRQSRILNGRERHFWTMPYGERFIWGVTAGIIRSLYERLYA